MKHQLKDYHIISVDIIDLDPSSPSHSNPDDIPISRVYQNLDNALPPSSSTKPTKEPDNVDESEPPYVDERIGTLLQQRIDICHNLLANHWLQPPWVKPLQTMLPDEKFEGDSVKTTSDNLTSTSSQPQPTTQISDSSVLDGLSNHYNSKLPGYEPSPETASETTLNFAYSENQQQPETTQPLDS